MIKKIFICFLIIIVFNASLVRAKEVKSYEGLFGMCGPMTPLQKRLELFEKAFRDYSWINGILILEEWKNIQPTPAAFNWTEVDRLVGLAAKYNKKVSLCFLSMHPPEWIYGKGVSKFVCTDINPHHGDRYGQKVILPVPVSEKFYELWRQFVKEAGKRYDSNPAVAAVVIVGVNFQGPETYIRLSSEEEREQAKEYDINAESVTAYWKRYIDLYAQAFPNTSCTMHIAEIFRTAPNVLNEVVAYGAERYPDQFQIQTDKLHGRTDQSGQHEYELIRKYSSKIKVGFQMVATFRDKERQGSMLMTLMNGLRADARYYELWIGDAVDPNISKPFYDLWQEGKQLGWEDLMDRAKAQGEYKTLREDNYPRQRDGSFQGRRPRSQRLMRR